MRNQDKTFTEFVGPDATGKIANSEQYLGFTILVEGATAGSAVTVQLSPRTGTWVEFPDGNPVPRVTAADGTLALTFILYATAPGGAQVTVAAAALDNVRVTTIMYDNTQYRGI